MQHCLLLLLFLQALLHLLLLLLLLLYRLYCCLTLLTLGAIQGPSLAVHIQLICQPLQQLLQQAAALLQLPSLCQAVHLCLLFVRCWLGACWCVHAAPECALS
jgi:hypothetical protein